MRPPDRAPLCAPRLRRRSPAPPTPAPPTLSSPTPSQRRSTSTTSFCFLRLDLGHDFADGFIDLLYLVSCGRFAGRERHQFFNSRKLAAYFFDQRLVANIRRNFA